VWLCRRSSRWVLVSSVLLHLEEVGRALEHGQEPGRASGVTCGEQQLRHHDAAGERALDYEVVPKGGRVVEGRNRGARGGGGGGGGGGGRGVVVLVPLCELRAATRAALHVVASRGAAVVAEHARRHIREAAVALAAVAHVVEPPEIRGAEPCEQWIRQHGGASVAEAVRVLRPDVAGPLCPLNHREVEFIVHTARGHELRVRHREHAPGLVQQLRVRCTCGAGCHTVVVLVRELVNFRGGKAAQHRGQHKATQQAAASRGAAAAEQAG
jgi:hypothetical protein